MLAPFSMAIRNVELMHECFPKDSLVGTEESNKTKKQEMKARREAWV